MPYIQIFLSDEADRAIAALAGQHRQSKRKEVLAAVDYYIRSIDAWSITKENDLEHDLPAE